MSSTSEQLSVTVKDDDSRIVTVSSKDGDIPSTNIAVTDYVPSFVEIEDYRQAKEYLESKANISEQSPDTAIYTSVPEEHIVVDIPNPEESVKDNDDNMESSISDEDSIKSTSVPSCNASQSYESWDECDGPYYVDLQSEGDYP